MPKKLTNIEFLQKASNNFTYLEEFINTTTHILVRCKKCQHEFKQTPKNNFKGRGCPKCLNPNKFKTNNELIGELIKIHKNRYCYKNTIITKLKYEEISIHCIKCDKDFKQLYEVHKNGHGCPICNGGVKKEHYKIIQNLIEIHPKLDFTNSVYIKSNASIEVGCKICDHTFNKTPNKLQQGQGCPRCKMSKGERKIENYLLDNSIDYVTQKKFDKCKDKRQLPFDFYLPKYNICIEYDGEQHYNKYRFEKDNSKLLIRQKRDTIKTIYCSDNNINLVRIPYYEQPNITKILDENIV